MAFDKKTTEKLTALFEGVDYRKIISERAECHPNTVTNVLNGNTNPRVECEILVLAQEINEQRRKAIEIMKQL